MNTFSLAVAIPNELLIAHMSIIAHLKTRLLALITNTITGRPYGIWRDYIVRVVTGNGKAGFVRMYIADTLAFGTFQLPLYLFNLAVGGKATLHQMTVASVTVTSIAGILGRPYGIYLEFLRQKFSGSDQSGFIDVLSNPNETTEGREESW